ncbi:MAG: MoxR family ATPase [Polyangiales bacterium]
MTKSQAPYRSASTASTTAKAKADASPTEVAVPIGPRVVALLDLAYRARRPVLLEGPTGIGKSQMVSEFARGAGLEAIVLDLSLLEPPDLVGLPVIDGDRTRYAVPAELPVQGRGVLLLEELNRAEIPVMQPALQLLSARRLHGYELPPGWMCCAAINPEDGDYQVHHLDPAMRSRFLQLTVCAEPTSWLAWAEREGVHPAITHVVREHHDAFDHAPPRSWAYASEVLHALRPGELADATLVGVALRGYLPGAWAMRVADSLSRQPSLPSLDPDVLFAEGGAAAFERIVRELEASRRTDAVVAVAWRLRRLLGGDELRARVEAGAVTREAIERLLAPLPGDLREQCLDAATRSMPGSRGAP